MNQFDVTVWGVMGSCPGASLAAGEKIGMNTPCVQVDTGNETVILDSGTGIVKLGNELNKLNKPLDIHLFITHSHWDHIQGFPFFAPAYESENTITIYGQFNEDYQLKEIFKGLMKPPYFPAPYSTLKANIKYKELSPVDVTTLPSGTKILNMPSDHPGGNLIYRVEYDDKKLCYITDLVHGHSINDQLMLFVKNTNLMIYDANFTNLEFIKPKYEGWGHSTWEKALQLAINSNVDHVVLFHHALHHTVEDLENTLLEAQRIFKSTSLAIEGDCYQLSQINHEKDL